MECRGHRNDPLQTKIKPENKETKEQSSPLVYILLTIIGSLLLLVLILVTLLAISNKKRRSAPTTSSAIQMRDISRTAEQPTMRYISSMQSGEPSEMNYAELNNAAILPLRPPRGPLCNDEERDSLFSELANTLNAGTMGQNNANQHDAIYQNDVAPDYENFRKPGPRLFPRA